MRVPALLSDLEPVVAPAKVGRAASSGACSLGVWGLVDEAGSRRLVCESLSRGGLPNGDVSLVRTEEADNASSLTAARLLAGNVGGAVTAVRLPATRTGSKSSRILTLPIFTGECVAAAAAAACLGLSLGGGTGTGTGTGCGRKAVPGVVLCERGCSSSRAGFAYWT